MDFSLSKKESFFRDHVRQAIRSLVIPVATKIDRENTFPRPLFEAFGELGYYGCRYPEALGGMDGDCLSFTILAEETAFASVSFAATLTMQSLMGTDFIYRYGTDDQKQTFLVPAIQGKKVGTIAFTEPDCGSDLGAVQTRAFADETGYTLRGRKMWITNGDVADFVTVAATVNPAQRLNGIAFFLVEKGRPGFSTGQKINKISARGSNTVELIFDDCHIPRENRLGPEGKGPAQLEAILSEIRIMIAGLAVGLSRSAFEEGLRYARERKAFGRTIGNFQLIQDKIAQMEMRIEASRLLAYQAAWLKDRGHKASKEAAAAKLFATETASYVTDQVTRIFGSYGIAEEYAAERLYRDARFLLYGGGTSEILTTLIARECLEGEGKKVGSGL